MNRVLNFFRIIIFVFVVSAVFVNLNPNVAGIPIEVLMFFSGIWGLVANSFYTLSILPVFFGIIMSAFGEGLLIYNVALSICFTFLMYYFKNKKNAYKVIAAFFLFVLRQFVLGDYGFSFPALNTLIFCFVYFAYVFIARRSIKGIF